MIKVILSALLAFLVAFAVMLEGTRGVAELPQDQQDYLYLAGIVYEATKDKESVAEQLMAVTDWLAENVAEVQEYPDWFDGSSVASVIRGGVGNCGYQANNIIVLAQYLGVFENRRYWVNAETGSRYMHAFSELVVDGRAMVFDPNNLRYALGADGVPLSLGNIVRNPSLVREGLFRKVAEEIARSRRVLRSGIAINKAPMPLGERSAQVMFEYGPFLTERYLVLRQHGMVVVGGALMVSLLVGFLMARRRSVSTP